MNTFCCMIVRHFLTRRTEENSINENSTQCCDKVRIDTTGYCSHIFCLLDLDNGKYITV